MSALKKIITHTHHCIQGREWYDAKFECGHEVTVRNKKQKKVKCRWCLIEQERGEE